MTYLAGDIGGTKTHLALYSQSFEKLCEKKYPSQEFETLQTIIKDFAQQTSDPIKGACLGIAGPIKDNMCVATNLPWTVKGSDVAATLGLKQAKLINDLEANAYGIRKLGAKDFVILNEGKGAKGNQALISAGTGLGEAGLYFDGHEHRPFACEGGHCDFAPRTPQEIKLLNFLSARFGGHVSYERVLSGPGLYNIYTFLTESESKERDERVEGAQEGERPKVVSDQGVSGSHPTCVEALELFVSLYGAEAGNLCLKFLAIGGLYIGGGIAPKILNVLQSGPFMPSFIGKGRFDKLLSEVPVKVILNEETALLGAAFVAISQQ